MAGRRKPYIVLVTGGSGFLGQHVIGLLQTRAAHVTEIRVLDIQPYVNKTDYESTKPVRQFIGSILNDEVTQEACTGADCVIHLASIIDITLFANMERSYQINVEGTRSIIEACKSTGVERLLYCSSAAVVLGYDNIFDEHEDDLEYPTEHLFPVYGKTKQQAEELVLAANGMSLKTITIRPPGIYGDYEEAFSVPMYSNAFTRHTGYYIPMGITFDKADMAYAGNIAWAFIQADDTLRENESSEAAGKCYFITDDTSRTIRPDSILNETSLTPLPLPAWLQIAVTRILICIVTFISFFWKTNFPVGVWAFHIRKLTWFLNREQAKRLLGYEPLYTPDEASKRVLKYIKSISN